MSEPEEQNTDEIEAPSVSGAFQAIIGEIEQIGGILTADPITQAEGEFNQEVGDIREDLEEDIEPDDPVEQ
jgi:hypothetical protein